MPHVYHHSNIPAVSDIPKCWNDGMRQPTIGTASCAKISISTAKVAECVDVQDWCVCVFQIIFYAHLNPSGDPIGIAFNLNQTSRFSIFVNAAYLSLREYIASSISTVSIRSISSISYGHVRIYCHGSNIYREHSAWCGVCKSFAHTQPHKRIRSDESINLSVRENLCVANGVFREHVYATRAHIHMTHQIGWRPVLFFTLHCVGRLF